MPQEVEEAIGKALSKAPADRYATVGEFANALQQASIESATPTASVGRRTTLTGPLGTAVRLAAVLLVVAAVGVAWNAWSGAAPTSAVARPAYQDSVAVRYLDNLTGDPSLDNFGRLLTDEIIGYFTEVSEIKPIGPQTISVLMGENLSISEMLDRSNAGYLIHGSLGRQGSELEVRVTLTDAEGVAQDSWSSDLFPRERADFVRREIAQQIRDLFMDHIGLSSVAFSDEEYSPATDLYAKGNTLLAQRTPAGVEEALAHFSAAILLNPTYAPAWAGRASGYALSIFYKYDVGFESYELAIAGLAAADRAVELDSTHAGGYAARGLLRSFVGMESELAMADFGQARDFAPNQSDIAAWEGRILSMQGRTGDAFGAYERALDLDPEHVARRIGLASIAFQLDDYERVILESQEALQRDSTMTMATAFQGWALALQARGEDCLDLDFGVYELVTAVCLDVAGRGPEGLAMIQEAETSLRTGSSGAYLEDVVTVQGLATYYGFVGDVAKAAEWVEHAFDLSPDPIDVRILGSNLFDKVRDDPDDPDDDTRFSEALERGRQLAREQVQAGRERLRSER